MNAESAAAAAMKIKASFSVGPIGDVPGNLATVLGESLLVVLGMFYPPPLCKKANVVITELLQNVFENVSAPGSTVKLDVSVDPSDALTVQCTNAATDAQYAAVSARVEQLTSVADPKKLFAETLRARRVQRLKGGLGLMRLVSENKFQLATDYRDGLLTVRAVFALRGME